MAAMAAATYVQPAALSTALTPPASSGDTMPPWLNSALARRLASNSTGSVIRAKTTAPANRITPIQASVVKRSKKPIRISIGARLLPNWTTGTMALRNWSGA